MTMVEQQVSQALYDLSDSRAADYRADGNRRYGAAAIVVGAVAITLSRWTAADEVTIAVRSCGAPTAYRLITVRICDNDTTESFLCCVEAHLSRAAVGDLRPSGGGSDVILDTDDATMLSGQILFTAEIPGILNGFVGDAAEAVRELTSEVVALQEVRCIAPGRRRLLQDLVGAPVPSVSIETLFLDRVRTQPDHIALREEGFSLTYKQLAQAADAYATVLRDAGVGAGDTVLIAIGRSVAEIVALLAVIRLGAAYAGLDGDAPAARTEKVVRKLKPSAAVVDTVTKENPALRCLTRVHAWNPEYPVCSGMSWSVPLEPGDPSRVAYVAFTSGSTGEPKGVIVTQRAVTRLAMAQELRMNITDTVMRMAPLAFDASTLEIWVALLQGATIEIFPDRLPSPGNLEAFFIERGVSVAGLPASLFRLVAKTRPAAFAGMRWIVTGGEVVPHESVAAVLETHPSLMITNGYGPTENTLFTTTHTVHSSAEVIGPLPIGRPIAGTKVFVLDSNARLLPPGAVGELYAAGIGLADGYIDNPLETANRFGCFSRDTCERLYRTGDLVRIDEHGQLLYLGRADKQVKLNGHRIETEEIAVALVAHADVRDAVIVAAYRDDRSLQLVAGVVTQAGRRPDPTVLREFLSQTLPTYMVPSLWSFVDSLPLTRNGKLDEQALIAAATPGTAHGQTRSSVH